MNACYTFGCVQQKAVFFSSFFFIIFLFLHPFQRTFENWSNWIKSPENKCLFKLCSDLHEATTAQCFCGQTSLWRHQCSGCYPEEVMNHTLLPFLFLAVTKYLTHYSLEKYLVTFVLHPKTCAKCSSWMGQKQRFVGLPRKRARNIWQFAVFSVSSPLSAITL